MTTISRARAILRMTTAVSAVMIPFIPAAAQSVAEAVDVSIETGGAVLPNRPAPTAVEDIIVTANRRDERNQSVPMMITAFSPERLRQLNITQSQDLQSSVPSLTVGGVGTGSRETQSFSLRGQGATFQASPGVVVYFNEVPLPSPTTLSQQGGPGNFVDLQSVQVLAGPQGTLFGRNTTGGAILLVPKKPTDRLEAYLQANIGNHDDREIEGVVNIPVVDDALMIRAVGRFQDRDGYTRDIVWNKDRDDVHYYTGRIGVLAKPSDSVENYLLIYGTRSDNHGTGNINKGFNLEALKAIGFCSDAACTPYSTATSIAGGLGPRKTALSVDAFQSTRTWGIENTTSVTLDDRFTVRNIASYQRFKLGFAIDPDATPLQQFDYGVARLPDFPVTVTDGSKTIGPFVYANEGPSYPRDNFRTITEELQLQGHAFGNRLMFAVGGFYFDQKPVSTQGYSSVTYCPAAFTGACAPTTTLQGVTTKSKALYLQGTLDLGTINQSLDELKLTGGYRYTWDHITGFNTSYKAGSGTEAGRFVCADTTVTLDPAGCTFRGDLRSKAPNWTVGLDYRLATQILLFGKVSRGYKAGGFNSFSVRPETRTFDPERVTTYEAGFKSDFRVGGMPARLNASYYYTSYANIQRTSADLNLSTGASGAAVRSARAWIQGLELEATLKPVPELEVGGNFSYGKGKYTHYEYPALLPTASCDGAVKGFGETVDVSCLPFAFLPKHTYSIHASLNIPAPGRLGDLSLLVNFAHTDAQHTENVILPPFQPGERLGGFGILNASLDLRGVGGSNLDIGLYVTNATNTLYRISNTDTFQPGSLLDWSTIYGEPRMYGLRLRYNFGA